MTPTSLGSCTTRRGCSHAPHHVAKGWADKYKGKFDGGWDKYREETLERRKKLGIVPADTELTERSEAFPAWDSLRDAQKKLYARQMEVFAGYSENADWNVGRLLDAIEEMGDLDDTLIFHIWGDNGASMEAERNRALPLLGGFDVFFGMLPAMPTVTRFSFAGDVQNVAVTLLPRIQGRSYAIEAELNVPDGGAERVLVAHADFIGGFALWVDEKGLLNHTYQFLGVDTHKQISTEPIPTGDVTVKMLFEADEPKSGTGGRVTLWANDQQIGEGTIPQTVSLIYTT